MPTILLDCYTDEPSGLGVPPYLGAYPRYLAGMLDSIGEEWDYLTIDDLRAARTNRLGASTPKLSGKTDIYTYNQTGQDVMSILGSCSKIIVILGVHAPGKYLSAVPGTLREVIPLIRDLDCEKILTGPAVFGTSLEGGRKSERIDLSIFDKIDSMEFSFEEIRQFSVSGARLVDSIPDIRLIEIETARGCSRAKGCSFCTEPLKHRFESRDSKDVIQEVKAFYDRGVRHFRIGKQACFFSIPDPIGILDGIHKSCPDIKVLHIDNVDPSMVNTPRGRKIAEAVVKYCTSGNIAAFGVESFDPKVIEENNLNTSPQGAYDAVKAINKVGRKIGANGLPAFLPGINILFGLIGESKETHVHNMAWLKRIIDDGLLLRRINIRQVAVFEGTPLHDSAGIKFLKKNRKHYFRWRDDIRQQVDVPNLERLLPVGHVLHDVRTEIYDGNTTFARHVGTYPIVVGIPGRLPLKKFFSVEVTKHMLRSITAKLYNHSFQLQTPQS
ncbi:MAG: radical SAM protein [Nanoarchaeota archaeon]